ncbi:MAG: GNAT family N-acetyltransferase [Aquiluna sp.]|nr:GNAT family N-acetyltransferase [Aquiluna sp.]MCF8545689.1 GNAT family N-acetyltransferase [Aquiluna sp.]
MSFSVAATLSHSLVRLEQLEVAHASELAESVGDLWKIWYTAIPAPGEMVAEIERRLDLQSQGKMVPFAVIDPDSGRAVGMTTYMNIDEPNRRVEIGSTWISKEVQRTGLNQAMKLLLLDHAFENLDCIAVEFRTHIHNLQSRAAIAGIGAKQDGILRNHQIDRFGNLRDTVSFSIIASEWPTVKHGLISRVGNVENKTN